MTRAQTSAYVFGGYLLVLGLGVFAFPAPLFAPFGFAPPADFWVRVIGVPVFILGWYYVHAARANVREFMRWTVVGRLFPAPAFGALVATGIAPPMLFAFALVDAAGAAWTAWALKKDAT